MKRKLRSLISTILLLAIVAAVWFIKENRKPAVDPIDLQNVPAFSNTAYVEINGNVPYFTEKDMTTEAYETYAELDSLGQRNK